MKRRRSLYARPVIVRGQQCAVARLTVKPGVILAAHLNTLLQGLAVGGFRSCVMEHRERRSVADRCAG
jgi:hypothetical protein